MHVDPRLFDYCETATQRKTLQAIVDNVDCKSASIAQGNHISSASATLQRIKKLAADAGYSPEASNMNGSAPVGFTVKRHSARFDKEGNAAGGWLISEPTKEQAWEAFTQAANDAAEQLKGLSKATPAPLMKRVGSWLGRWGFRLAGE